MESINFTSAETGFLLRLVEKDYFCSVILELVKEKLSVPGTGSINVSDERLEALRRQVDAELRPVLRDEDFRNFDLERAFSTIKTLSLQVK